MIEKDPGDPKITCLRIICLYEADYNLLAATHVRFLQQISEYTIPYIHLYMYNVGAKFRATSAHAAAGTYHKCSILGTAAWALR